MSLKQGTASLHRFRDHVAVSVGTGETNYFTAAEARRFAHALTRATTSIERTAAVNAPAIAFEIPEGQKS